jgi:hypothetical protein
MATENRIDWSFRAGVDCAITLLLGTIALIFIPISLLARTVEKRSPRRKLPVAES